MKLKNQKFKYGEIPSKEYLENLYPKHTQQEIADMHGTYKSRVRKWLKHHNISIKVQGGGNNHKYKYKKEELIELINSRYTNKQLAEYFECSKSNICRVLKKLDIKRNYSISEFQKYKNRVHRLSERIYVDNKDILNPENKPRTLCGVKGGYQLDHIKSIKECFIDNISEEDCSKLENLQFITWEENLNKRNPNLLEKNKNV